MTIGQMYIGTTFRYGRIIGNSALLEGHWIDLLFHIQNIYSGIRESLDVGFLLVQTIGSVVSYTPIIFFHLMYFVFLMIIVISIY